MSNPPSDDRSRLDEILRAQSGDRDAQQRLADQHEPMFKSTVRRLHTPAQEVEDGLQGARVGFLEALGRFDPDAGKSLGAYAKGFVIKGVLEATFRTPRAQRQVTGSGAQLEDVPEDLLAEDDPGFERVEDAFAAPEVRSFFDALPENRKQIAYEVGIAERSVAEIADERNVTPRAIYKVWGKIVVEGRQALAHLWDEAA